MCSRPQFNDLTYMGGTGPCGPMRLGELVNKPKYLIWCESDFPCSQDPGIADIAHFQYRPAYAFRRNRHYVVFVFPLRL